MQEDSSDLPLPLRDGKVLPGREGRLFLADDFNRVLEQHTGRLRFTDEQLQQWRTLLDGRTASLRRDGARHVFLIAPDAHSVYPDLLPEGWESARERPVDQLLGRMGGAATPIVYPLDELVRHRNEAVYPKTGSHWSGLGAFYAYGVLAERLGERGIGRTLSIADVDIREATVVGDLGAKLEPSAPSRFVYVTPREPRAQVVADNRVRNRGRRVTWEGGRSGAECLVYGDSFAMRLLPLLAEGFGRLTFVHMPTLDRELVEELRPDVVVGEMNERCLIVVPSDADGPPWREVEARKVAAADLLPALPDTPGDASPSASRGPAGADRAQAPRA